MDCVASLAVTFLENVEIKRPRKGPFRWKPKSERADSLDLGFLELDMLARDRVVFLERELLRLGAGVLLGHVIKAGVGARQQLDLDRGGLGHGASSIKRSAWR